MKVFNCLVGILFSVGAVVLGLGAAFYLSLEQWLFGLMLLIGCVLAAATAFVSLRFAFKA